MKISAQMAVVAAAIFSAICFAVALKGFVSIADMADATQLADAKGFAWFWSFLGGVGVLCGALSVWIVRTRKDE